MKHKFIYEIIYELLYKICPELDNFEEGQYVQLVSNGLMPLSIELIEKTRETKLFALAHYKEKNSDLVPDPDMLIRIRDKYAEAISYQDEFGYIVVYTENGGINISAKKSMNVFLKQWLNRILKAEYHLELEQLQ